MRWQKKASILMLLNLLVFTFIHGQETLSLEKSLTIARENSPDILRTIMALEQSRENLNAQRASLKSQFRLNVTPFSFDRSREFNPLFSTFSTSETKQSSGTFQISQPIVATDGTLSLSNRLTWRDAFNDFQGTRSETFTNNLFLAFNQPIFTYNRTRLNLQDLELDLENSEISYQLQLLSLEQRVTQAFYSAYQQKMRLQISEEEFQNSKTSFDITTNKVDAGLLAREELFQAELNLTSSRSQLQNDQVNLANTLDDFKQLIGLPLENDITVTADIVQEAIAVNLQDAIRKGLDNRMELRQRNIDLLNAQANLTRATATNEFKGNISLEYGIFGNDEEFNRVYDNPTQSQAVSFSLEIPLYDWGQRNSTIRSSEISVERSKLSLAEEKTGIVLGIRKSYRSLQNQAVQIEIAKQNVKLAESTYDINLERYQNGDLTSWELNQFQIQLSDKKIGLVNALINYKLSLLDLKIKALWDFERNQAVIIE